MWEEAFERIRKEVLRQRRELSDLKREVLDDAAKNAGGPSQFSVDCLT